MSSTSPASQTEATGALRALFAAFPSDRGGLEGVATYLMAVEGYSIRAIEKAVKRIIRGEADGIDKRFLPTPAQVGNLVGYMEKLLAPVESKLALPAPGSSTLTEDEWAARAKQAAAIRERFGIKKTTGEAVVDREAIPAAQLKVLDDKANAVAARIKAEGWPKLSPEALRLCVPDPAEQFDAWQAKQAEEDAA